MYFHVHLGFHGVHRNTTHTTIVIAYSTCCWVIKIAAYLRTQLGDVSFIRLSLCLAGKRLQGAIHTLYFLLLFLEIRCGLDMNNKNKIVLQFQLEIGLWF